MSFETRLHLPCLKIKVHFFIVQVNPGITLDQFALSVDLEDNYKTDSYDLEYPGLIMTIRSYLADRGLIKQKKVIHIDASFQVNKRCWISPPSDLSATVWKCVLIISFFLKLNGFHPPPLPRWICLAISKLCPLPSSIFVLLGWMALFIPRTSVPGRS